MHYHWVFYRHPFSCCCWGCAQLSISPPCMISWPFIRLPLHVTTVDHHKTESLPSAKPRHKRRGGTKINSDVTHLASLLTHQSKNILRPVHKFVRKQLLILVFLDLIIISTCIFDITSFWKKGRVGWGNFDFMTVNSSYPLRVDYGL